MRSKHPVARRLGDCSIAVEYHIIKTDGDSRTGHVIFSPGDPDYAFWDSQITQFGNALPRPLRTGRARFPGTGSSKP